MVYTISEFVISDTESECPGCGSHEKPQIVVACKERIEFHNCRSCDFSTWDAKDYDPR